MLQSIVFHTLGQMATGILFFIAFVPPSRIGSGFGRFHTILSLLLWIPALWGNFSAAFLLLAAVLLIACFVSGNDKFYYPCLFTAFLLSSFLLMKFDWDKLGFLAALLIHLPPALVLGGSAVAMLLGHWYLVAPKLPIGYLKTLTIGLIVALLLRSGLLAGMLLGNGARLTEIHFYEIYGIFFLQRITLGLLLTLVLSVLTYFCVRIRSTQSATGILYVVVVFCLIGELIGTYLFAKTGIGF